MRTLIQIVTIKQFVNCMVVLLCTFVNAHATQINHPIYEEMKIQKVDSIKLIFEANLIFTRADLTVVVSTDTTKFDLDTLSHNKVTGKPEFISYPAKLSERSQNYILSGINNFFLSRRKSIFSYRRKNNFNAESDNSELYIYIYKNNKRIRLWYILGDYYSTKPDYVGCETHQYTLDFMKFIQLITYISGTQGPYSLRYDDLIKGRCGRENYTDPFVVYDFSNW